MKQRIPLVDLKAQYYSIREDIDQAIEKVIKKTDFIMGEEVSIFENEFSKFLNVDYAVGVSSGTDALHLALYSLGVGRNDEVIVPSHTFTATAEIIAWLGAKPVFADIDEKTYTISPKEIEKAITKRTKAIIPVHLYGHPADMLPIVNIAKKNNIFIIEDCAQAHGAKYRERIVGNFSDMAAFSFYPGKNLGAYGDAGMVVTNNKKLADKIKILRNHGRKEKYTHQIIGFGNRLDTLQAAILSAKLKYLNDWNKARRRIAGRYNTSLKSLEEVILPVEQSWAESVYHLYVIQANKRDELRSYLKEKGIETGIHYPLPLHMQPAYKYLGYKKNDLKITTYIAEQIVSLPLYPEIEDDTVDYICKCIKDFYH